MHKIKELRKKKGEKQSDLANLLSVSLRTVQNYEAGKVDIPTKKLKIIADHYNVSVSFLFSEHSFDDVENQVLTPEKILNVLEILFTKEDELLKYEMYVNWKEMIKSEAKNEALNEFKSKLLKNKG